MSRSVVRRSRSGGSATALLAAALVALPGCSGQADWVGFADQTLAAFGPWSTPVNLGAAVNSASSDGCLTITRDRLTRLIASTRPTTPGGSAGNPKIWGSSRSTVDDEWSEPQLIVALNAEAEARDLCPTLSVDGHTVFISSNRAGGCGGMDLYRSTRRDKRDLQGWGAPENLGCDFNSDKDDWTAAIGNDRIYFGSNRAGGKGLNDIWVSEKGPDGTYGTPTPVAELNTEYDDQRPGIRHDGKEIFFESNRPGGEGSFDLYVSSRGQASGPWSAPANLGAPVNSAASEGRPWVSFDGETLYFLSSRSGPGALGGADIYMSRRERIPASN